MGRPKGTTKLKVTDELLAQIAVLAGYGMTLAQTSDCLGISRQQFNVYRSNFPDIDQAYQSGKSLAQSAVSESLFRKALSGDMAAIRWYEITRAGRKENAELEVNHHYVVPLPDEDESSESWQQRILAKHSVMIEGEKIE